MATVGVKGLSKGEV